MAKFHNISPTQRDSLFGRSNYDGEAVKMPEKLSIQSIFY